MKLEDYFDFLAPNDIRIRGHRIGIQDILYEHIYRARTPQEIVERFPTLSLEEILASLLYYERERTTPDRYMAEWLEWGFQQRKAQADDPSLDKIRERLAHVPGR